MNTRLIKYNFLKKCFRIFKILGCVLLAALMMTSCKGGEEPRNSGIKANEELLNSIYQELQEQKQPILADEGDVFFTPNGTIWHTDPECSSLARSETILHGTIEEAMTAGKERACLRCSKSEEPTPDDEIEEGDVFFTPSGTTWHESAECTYLSRSETILHGSIDEAIEKGKERPCSKCYPEKEPDNENEQGGDEIDNGDSIVFWTKSGACWHVSTECYHIADSDNVQSGSIQDALAADKERPCSKCYPDDDSQEGETEENEDAEIVEGEVYWTESGSRWHTHRDCYHIVDSKKVKSGSVQEAIDEEKVGLCSHCEKKDKK